IGAAAGKDKPPADPSKPSPTRPRRFSIEQITRPEPMVFLYMRNLAVAAAGQQSLQFREQVERWRILSHDRKRKVGSNWDSPGDFVRRRKAFLESLKKAEELLRKARRRGRDAKTRAEQKRNRSAAMGKLLQAAGVWNDPLLREFLLGVAEYHRKQYGGARLHFRNCCEQAPQIAAFHQGYGLALLGLDRPLDALEEFVTVLRLAPNSRDAILLVREAMKKVPGAKTGTEIYKAAEALLAEYDLSKVRASSYSNRIRWLGPGKYGSAQEESLPVPPMDRFVFRQAVGVPVAAGALLVDAPTVTDALEVHVWIDEQTVVPAKAQRVYSSRDTTNELVLVTVSGCEFTPVGTDEDPKRKAGQSILAFGVGTYQQMGTLIRTVPGKITSAGGDEGVAVSVKLLPGEPAAPVLTDDNRLVGFLAGKIDVRTDGGGRDRFIPLGRIAKILQRTHRSPSYSGYSYLKRKGKPKKVEGTFFVVLATFGEKLEP
ncbi:MAG TPA: hypothetical protein VMZ50_07505, partial [Phycisphaerae bacterium]|nr:hypothetical protein [Phycisphaerae bacterium]